MAAGDRARPAAGRWLLVAAAMGVLASSGCAPRVLLGRFEAATFAGSIGSGGWDSNVTKRFFASRLSDCGPRVVSAANDWAAANALSVIKRDLRPRRALVHVGDVDLRGFYEILYHLDDDRRRASISVEYYDKHGDVSEPTALSGRAAKLISELETALTCAGE